MTGRNALANATNYRKLAAVRTITIKGCLTSPFLPQQRIPDGRGESVPQGWWEGRQSSKGSHEPRLRLQHGLLARRQVKGEFGNVL